MMKIPVKYNDCYYYWVDSVVMHDEYDYVCAVLISKFGTAFAINMREITVVDDNYDYEKNIQKTIERLKIESFQLQEQMKLGEKLRDLR